MLVKIVAIGFTGAVWGNVFRELRNRLPSQPFSTAVFSTPREREFLEREFFPGQWKKESPDFLFCEGRGEGQPVPGQDFLARLRGYSGMPLPKLVLAFDSLEKGLKHSAGIAPPLSLTLDTGGVYTLSDPALLLRSFPVGFPRIPVDDHVTTLRLRGDGGGGGEIRAQEIRPGQLVGFSEIEALIHQGEARRPKDWLKQVTQQERLKKRPRAGGLIREPKGLFLFPGIPYERIRGVELAGNQFEYLIELKNTTTGSPQFETLVEAVAACGKRQAEGKEAHSVRIHEAEARADIPMVCGGNNPLLRESMTALLGRRGFQRCFSLTTPGEGIFREPSLLIQVAPWGEGGLGVQAEEPHLLDISENLEKRLKPLDRLLPWRELPYRPPPVDIPALSRTEFTQRQKRLATRAKRAEKEHTLEERRVVLQEQEAKVLRAAREKLTAMLALEGAVQVWDGHLPPAIRQVLLFSHDAEEAGMVLQSLGNIQKKRWVDLAEYGDADSLQNLSLEEFGHYAENGAILITPSSRQRLEATREKIETTLPEAEQNLASTRAALERLRTETRAVSESVEKLARNWIWESLNGWLEENRKGFNQVLEAVRLRHERRWLNRSQVHRALIIPYARENGTPLLDACGEVFPGFNRNLSMVVPYEFDFLDELPEPESTELRQQGHAEGLSPVGLEKREAEVLARHNEVLFADYLQVVSGELVDTRMDLVLIDHRPEIASRILAHLRNSLPHLKNVPAILLLSDYWAPQPDQPLPWPRTRVVLLRRMGGLKSADCARHLRDLYPM